jgi:hypothetical protein
MSAPAVWVIYTLLVGTPMKSSGDTLKFSNQSGCELYLHTTFGDAVIQAFRLVCFKQSS